MRLAIRQADYLSVPDERLYFRRLNRKYKKFLYLYTKYRENSGAATVQNRYIINRLFRMHGALAKDTRLADVDLSYLRIFIEQKFTLVSYPKHDFFFKYVKVESQDISSLNINKRTNP